MLLVNVLMYANEHDLKPSRIDLNETHMYARAGTSATKQVTCKGEKWVGSS